MIQAIRIFEDLFTNSGALKIQKAGASTLTTSLLNFFGGKILLAVPMLKIIIGSLWNFNVNDASRNSGMPAC